MSRQPACCVDFSLAVETSCQMSHQHESTTTQCHHHHHQHHHHHHHVCLASEVMDGFVWNTGSSQRIDWDEVIKFWASLLRHRMTSSNISIIDIYFYYYAALLPRRGPHIASHSVCPSVCLSVCPVIIIERHVAPPSELQWHTRRGPHIVRPSRPHKLVVLCVCMV